MGKFSLLLVVAAAIAGSIIMAQSNSTVVISAEKHAERQEELLAREIARSGLNQQLALLRERERLNPLIDTESLILNVNEVSTGAHSILEPKLPQISGDDDDDDDDDNTSGSSSGTVTDIMQTSVRSNERWAEYQGGVFETAVGMTGSSAFTVISVGTFGKARHVVTEQHLRRGTLTVSDSSTFTARFIESQAGYCSAIYLQRMIPRNNKGHGNNIDGIDLDNTGGKKYLSDSDPFVDDEKDIGNAKARFSLLEPELIFAPGKNRNGALATYSTTIAPGTMLNFILAVDKNCSEKDRTDLKLSSKKYDYYHAALEGGVANLDEMREGKYAMVQQNPVDPAKWRIAFEDLIKFSDEQHLDIKANSYGDGKWQKRSNGKYSYGGRGWTLKDSWGYSKLSDYGDLPDFSDQVFEVTLTPTKPIV